MCLGELPSAFRSSEPLAHSMVPPYSGKVILSESAPDPHAHCLQRHSQDLPRMHFIVFWVSLIQPSRQLRLTLIVLTMISSDPSVSRLVLEHLKK